VGVRDRVRGEEALAVDLAGRSEPGPPAVEEELVGEVVEVAADGCRRTDEAAARLVPLEERPPLPEEGDRLVQRAEPPDSTQVEVRGRDLPAGGNAGVGSFVGHLREFLDCPAGEVERRVQRPLGDEAYRGIAPGLLGDVGVQPDQAGLDHADSCPVEAPDEYSRKVGRAHPRRGVGIVDPDSEHRRSHQYLYQARENPFVVRCHRNTSSRRSRACS